MIDIKDNDNTEHRHGVVYAKAHMGHALSSHILLCMSTIFPTVSRLCVHTHKKRGLVKLFGQEIP